MDELEAMEQRPGVKGSPAGLDLAYGVDEPLPVITALMQGLQWLVTFLPVLAVVAAVVGEFYGFGLEAKSIFFERMLLVCGLMTIVQAFWGHGLPIMEGPAAALILAYATTREQGFAAARGAMIVGGVSFLLLVSFRLLRYVVPLFTPRVVGVVLLMIALTAVPFVGPMLIGAGPQNPAGSPAVFALSLGVLLLVAVLSHYGAFLLRSLAIFIGVAAGTLVYAVFAGLDMTAFQAAPLVSWPRPSPVAGIVFEPGVCLAFLLAYLVMLANSAGSIISLAELVGAAGLEKRVNRGVFVNGIGGVMAALGGTAGVISYSTSPGTIAVTRVASRYAVAVMGGLLIVMAFSAKLSGLFAAVPPPVAAAALTAALAAQAGVSLRMLMPPGQPYASREYMVIGLPVLIGLTSTYLPEAFLFKLPYFLRPVAGNGLVLSLLAVLVLEHVILRPREGAG